MAFNINIIRIKVKDILLRGSRARDENQQLLNIKRMLITYLRVCKAIYCPQSHTFEL